MKVLIAAHGYPPNQAAGAEVQAYRTAREMHRQGHDVSVVAVDRADTRQPAGGHVSQERRNDIPVTRFSYFLDHEWDNPAKFDNRDIYTFMSRHLAEQRPDIVHIMSGYRLGSGAIDAVKDAGLPLVLTLTDYWFLCPRITLRRPREVLCTVPDDPLECALCLSVAKRRYRHLQQKSAGRFGQAMLPLWQRGWLRPAFISNLDKTIQQRRVTLKGALDRVDCIIALSRFLGEMHLAQGLDPARMTFIRQGVDRANWQPAADRPVRTDTLHIGFIGQISAHKGVDLLLAAFQRLQTSRRRPRLFLYGDLDLAQPDLRGRLQAAAGADVILAGRFANEMLPAVHANLDLLVVPSRWYENSPNVILEAFSCGTPVIAADLGGMAELVRPEQSGLLFNADDAADLARQLQRVVDEPALLERWRQALPPVKDVRAEIVELAAVYRRLLATAGAAE